MAKIRRVAINTGGGDAPGLNAVIQAAVYAALARGWQIAGIRDGYDGLLLPQQFPDGGLVELTRSVVDNIAHLGGTILGTTNRGNPLRYREQKPDGSFVDHDRSAQLLAAFEQNGLDALIAVGGDGSLTIAEHLYRQGLRVVGVPKTIDNDLEATSVTFGFHSAVDFATECIDRLHATAQAHRRILVVEVMGRYAGWIALNCGLAGRADAILIPEIPFEVGRVAAALQTRFAAGKGYAMVVVAEGACAVGGQMMFQPQAPGSPARLGGIGEWVATELSRATGHEARAVVLGHLLRGGSPRAIDRVLALGFGSAAVRALAEGQNGVMVALHPPCLEYVPLVQAIQRIRKVPLDSDGVLTARALGISFGD